MGDDFIIHGLFVNDIKSLSILTKKALLDTILADYPRAFQNTGGKVMAQFMGLIVTVEKTKDHIDQYIADTL